MERDDDYMLCDIMKNIRSGELTLLAGCPDSGKTVLAAEMAEYLASEEEVLFFSLQHEKQDMINKYLGIVNKEKLIIEDTPGISITEVRNRCFQLVPGHKIKWIFIDCLPLMSGSKCCDSRVGELQEIVRDLRLLARETGIAIVAIVPLSQNPDNRPAIGDLREYGFCSGQEADLVLLIWDEIKEMKKAIAIVNPRDDAGEMVSYRYDDTRRIMQWAIESDERMERDIEREGLENHKKRVKEELEQMSNSELDLALEAYEKDMQAALDKAILLAAKYHTGQRDKQGKNYILHPLRVMLKETDTWSMMIAVLHDILEDTECTEDILRKEGIPENVIEEVKCLTRRENEDYFTYINRVNQNHSCKCIKQKDIEDNLRRGCPESLEKRYRKALEILEDRGLYRFHKIIKGNIDLAYSGQKDDGSIYVYCEQPDEVYSLKTAMIRKNDLEIIGHYGFSEEELQNILEKI